MDTTVPTFLCLILLLLGNMKEFECQEQLPEKPVIPIENVLQENSENQTIPRVKRQFGFFPPDPFFRPLPLPIIAGIGGFGIGGFGGGFGGFGRGFGGYGGRGFGGRGFGGRGFGGRGFGGRGFGGRGFGGRGFGGRGFGGGFGGRGFGGFGGRGRG